MRKFKDIFQIAVHHDMTMCMEICNGAQFSNTVRLDEFIYSAIIYCTSCVVSM
jgi:hypothetical protein